MIFTLKDLTADTYTEVTVVQKEDGTKETVEKEC